MCVCFELLKYNVLLSKLNEQEINRIENVFHSASFSQNGQIPLSNLRSESATI